MYALQGGNSGTPLAISRPPQMGGGNVIVEIDKKDYEKECLDANMMLLVGLCYRRETNPIFQRTLKVS